MEQRGGVPVPRVAGLRRRAGAVGPGDVPEVLAGLGGQTFSPSVWLVNAGADSFYGRLSACSIFRLGLQCAHTVHSGTVTYAMSMVLCMFCDHTVEQ